MGKIFFLLRDKINKKIVNLLVKKKSIEKSEIHKNINETRELVYYRINDLIDQEILSQIDEKNNLIRLNPDNKDLIIQICNNLANKNRNNSNI
jgi:hypothetical protein